MNETHKPVSDRIICLIIVLFLSASIMIAVPGRAAENILQTIFPDQANRLILDNKENPDFLIIDIRTRKEFRTGHLEGAVLIDYYAKDFLKKMQALDKTKTYLIYCRSANRSTRALNLIADMGFAEMYNIAQGIEGWSRKGFKITTHTKQDDIIQNLPGAEVFNMELQDQIKTMAKQRDFNYKPRTKHLGKNGWAKYTNRLFLEPSPYLLQHAHNPVNWYPWGDEAFKTAREKGLPILLSIGYSTCHWCHVMEEESFEDVEIAKYINENYIAIKVDREERPDVDAIYMSAVQAITGRGGWPMTVWLTPDRKPFYGGTYFPARDGDRGASMGFLTLLGKVKESYDQNPDMISQTSTRLTEIIQQMVVPEKGSATPLESVLRTAVAQLKSRYDKINGGVLGAPKFPSTMPVRLLLRYYRRTSDKTVLEMAEQTLFKMAAGGIYDKVGGGFHRYATDEKWLVPHFEKMLYDNALLIMAYLEGYQVSGHKEFKQIVEESLLYIKREMTAPDGGFYSATDADSLTPVGESKEGYYFTWTKKELETILGKKNTEIIAPYFNVTAKGNFEGRNILNITHPPDVTAKDFNISEPVLSDLLLEAKSKLYAYRTQRPLPLRDEKILTAWNGLMISAFARSGLVLGNSEYIRMAKIAAKFILENLYRDNQLFRSYMDGKAVHMAYLDDYAFFIAALLDLFEADPDPYWFQSAVALEKIMSDYFEDKADGGYFMTADNHEQMIAREKPGYDGAVPSGNSVAAMSLLRLYEFTANDAYRKRAFDTFVSFSRLFESNPLGISEMLMALDYSLDSPKEVVIVSPNKKMPGNDKFLNAFRKVYLPNRILIQVEEGAHAENLGTFLPVAKGKTIVEGKPVAYICENGICRLPSFTVDEFAEQLQIVNVMKE